MVKILAAQNRLMKNIFICKNCSSKMRSDPRKIILGKVKCRKCSSKDFRAIRKK